MDISAPYVHLHYILHRAAREVFERLKSDVMRTLIISHLNKFQVYNTVLLPIVTILGLALQSLLILQN